VAQGRAKRSTCQGGAGDWKTRSGSTQQSGLNRGEAEELKRPGGPRGRQAGCLRRRKQETEARRDHQRLRAGRDQPRCRRPGVAWDQ